MSDLPWLSEEGQRRREEIIRAAAARAPTIARARRRKRRAVRTAAGAIVLAPAIGLIVAGALRSPAPPAPIAVSTAPPPTRAAPVRVEVVQTLVDPAQRLLSDDELLALLDSIGRHTGLVRVGGEVTLTAAVTDEELARKREPLRPGESLR